MPCMHIGQRQILQQLQTLEPNSGPWDLKENEDMERMTDSMLFSVIVCPSNWKKSESIVVQVVIVLDDLHSGFSIKFGP